MGPFKKSIVRFRAFSRPCDIRPRDTTVHGIWHAMHESHVVVLRWLTSVQIPSFMTRSTQQGSDLDKRSLFLSLLQLTRISMRDISLAPAMTIVCSALKQYKVIKLEGSRSFVDSFTVLFAVSWTIIIKPEKINISMVEFDYSIVEHFYLVLWCRKLRDFFMLRKTLWECKSGYTVHTSPR